MKRALFDVEPGESYVVEFCQRDDRTRYVSVRLAELVRVNPDVLLVSFPILGRDLLGQSLRDLEDVLRVGDGTRIVFEAHGAWFSAEEAEHLRREDLGEPVGQAPWIGGKRPR